MSLFNIIPVSSADIRLTSIAADKIRFYGKLESESYAHWVFSGSNPLTSINEQPKLLTEQNPATNVYNSNFMTISTIKSRGLVSDRMTSLSPDQYTIAAVFRRPTLTPNNIAIYGNLGTDKGGSLLCNETIYFESYKNFSSAIITGGTPEAAQWVFAASSFNLHSGGQELKTLHGGVPINTRASSGPYIPNTSVGLGLGSVSDYNSANTSLDVAEFIIFNKALTDEELQGLYSRSKGRMATQGITVE